MRGPCRRCGHTRGSRVAYRYSSGARAVRHRCSRCETLTIYSLPGGQDYAATLPLALDRLGEAPPCERCGAAGTELHHWAPVSLFPDAGEWPTSYLCRRCHDYWHRRTGVAWVAA